MTRQARQLCAVRGGGDRTCLPHRKAISDTSSLESGIQHAWSRGEGLIQAFNRGSRAIPPVTLEDNSASIRADLPGAGRIEQQPDDSVCKGIRAVRNDVYRGPRETPRSLAR